MLVVLKRFSTTDYSFATHLIRVFLRFPYGLFAILGWPLATTITTSLANARLKDDYSTIDGGSCMVYHGVTSNALRLPTMAP